MFKTLPGKRLLLASAAIALCFGGLQALADEKKPEKHDARERMYFNRDR